VKLREHPMSLFWRLTAVAGIALTAAAGATASGGQAMAAARPHLRTAEGASPAIPQLGFVQTAKTASGTVEVHIDTFSNGFHRVLNAVSDFSLADAANGTFQLIGNVNGEPELGFIKFPAPGSPNVEVQLDTFSNGSYHRVLIAASDFAVGTGLGPFQLFGSVNGEPELGFVLSPDFQHFPAEVFVDDFSNGSYQRTSSPFSDLRPDAVPSPTFQLFGRDNGEPELGSINYANTVSGTVELHADAVVTAGGGYTRVLNATSDFSPADRPNGTFQLFGSANGEPELGFIKTANTGTHTVEVHADAITNGSYQQFLDSGSDFSPADAANGTFQLLGS
jgi:hypothetical protein